MEVYESGCLKVDLDSILLENDLLLAMFLSQINFMCLAPGCSARKQTKLT